MRVQGGKVRYIKCYNVDGNVCRIRTPRSRYPLLPLDYEKSEREVGGGVSFK